MSWFSKFRRKPTIAAAASAQTETLAKGLDSVVEAINRGSTLAQSRESLMTEARQRLALMDASRVMVACACGSVDIAEPSPDLLNLLAAAYPALLRPGQPSQGRPSRQRPRSKRQARHG